MMIYYSLINSKLSIYSVENVPILAFFALHTRRLAVATHL